jgi:hypothetical protein
MREPGDQERQEVEDPEIISNKYELEDDERKQ